MNLKLTQMLRISKQEHENTDYYYRPYVQGAEERLNVLSRDDEIFKYIQIEILEMKTTVF